MTADRVLVLVVALAFRVRTLAPATGCAASLTGALSVGRLANREGPSARAVLSNCNMALRE